MSGTHGDRGGRGVRAGGTWHAAGGFALVELAAAGVAAGVLLVVVAALPGRVRTSGWQAASLNNLREFAAVTQSHAADHQGAFFGFTWKAGVPTGSQYLDLQGPFVDDMGAAAAQAIDILRRRAGRTDIPLPSAWVPHPLYQHLVAAECTITSGASIYNII